MNLIRKSMTLGLVATLVGVAFAADEPPQTIQADDLSFKVPADWKKETPKSNMRKAQLKVGSSKGDDDAAELTVFVFPNGAGSVESNIDRWEKQFVDADKKTPKAKVEKKKGMNIDVTRVEIAGRYVASVMPGASAKNDKPNYKLLGAIVETKEAGYFLKLTGPNKTIEDATKAFDALIESMKIDK